ncbi:MAG: methyltransferase type 11, partial [Ramlibacter sp.]|nr:methyltransferase type 11 [Ramlibacter sp.]
EDITCENDTFTFHFAGSPSVVLDEFLRYYGPAMNAYEAAEKSGKGDQLRQQLEALFASQNKSPTAERTSVAATFLRVTVRTH